MAAKVAVKWSEIADRNIDGIYEALIVEEMGQRIRSKHAAQLRKALQFPDSQSRLERARSAHHSGVRDLGYSISHSAVVAALRTWLGA